MSLPVAGQNYSLTLVSWSNGLSSASDLIYQATSERSRFVYVLKIGDKFFLDSLEIRSCDMVGWIIYLLKDIQRYY